MLKGRRLALFAAILFFLSAAVPSFKTPTAQARLHTLPFEFDYVSWELNALFVKASQTGGSPWQVLTPEQQHQLVSRYLSMTYSLEMLQARLQQIYANPAIEHPEQDAQSELAEQQALQSALEALGPMVESILEGQVNEVISDEGIARLGNAIPSPLFHATPLPKALIVSPRAEIRQEVNLSLLADMTLAEISQLESQVEESTGGSALVVDVGGIGVYPTMVMRSSNLPWIVNTIAHEWTHNYLTLRPLGLNYDTTSELRTMNETAASISGDEIGQMVMQRYYPEYLAKPIEGKKTASLSAAQEVFDFRVEMHITRVKVDELLAEGKIKEAEAYMEERRILFVNQGYDLRKLNQAYFAFYGAYADQPGGAAGQDPVGPAVRQLRTQCGSLANFLQTIGRMDSYADLQAELENS